jgi:putative acetyltransferase
MAWDINCLFSVTKTSAIEVRREQPGDEAAITHVNDKAFGQPDESRIVDAIRKAGHATIALVAIDAGKIVGHILFSPVAIESPGPAIAALGLGPMAVLPEFQRRGIGSMLVQAGLKECARTGCQTVVVVGHPEFYPRFGFRPAHMFGLKCEFTVPDDVFMVVELISGALSGRHGMVRYRPEFGSAS